MPRARTNVERTPARRPRSWGHGSRAGHRTERARQRTRRTGGPLALFILILIALGVSAERAQAQVSISSQDNQTFTNGDPSTLASTITITEAPTGARKIKATFDIRIHIPAGFQMSWDTGITTPAFTGSAAGKVSSTVSYPDDQTLLVDVLTNFLSGDQLIIDGLRFTTFNGASAADNLEMELKNDGTVTATDDKTITILGVSAAIFATSPASLTEGNLAGATLTVDLTDGTYVATPLTSHFTLIGAPTGTTISGVTRDSGTRATLTLAFDGTDFDADASLSVTVLQTALATGTGPATTGSVPVTAVLELTAATISSTSGTEQKPGEAGTALADPFVVTVTDANANPVSGVSVTFAVTGGGGSLSNAQPQRTNASGQASTTLTLGTAAGVNTVTATATGLTGSPVTFTAIGVGPELFIEKLLSGPNTARIGEEIGYSIRYGNSSAVATARGVMLSDTLPVGLEFLSSQPTAQVAGHVLTWNLGDVAPGDTLVVGLTVRVSSQIRDTLRVRNVAAVSGLNFSNVAAAAAEVELIGVSRTQLSLDKTADVLQAAVGETVSFTIQLQNTGSSAIGRVVVSDTLPHEMSFVEGSASGADSVRSSDGVITFFSAAPLDPGASRTIRYAAAIVSGGSDVL
ncbi:MAG: Ig-like domain-containing protein, partial [Gemmatimonadota bacterium]